MTATTTATATISEAFQNLLASDGCHNHNQPLAFSGDIDDDASDGTSVIGDLERQGRLCAVLAQTLRSSKQGALRDVLGDEASSLGPLLGPLLRDRVDNQALLPATQDAAANDEVLESTTNALTLTLPAVQAAWLYAQVLNLPGALGSGLVDLEWLTGLTAVVRRWSMECCGREEELLTGTEAKKDSSDNKKTKSPTRSPPKKRSRRGQLSCESSDQSEDEAMDPEFYEGNECYRNVLQLGLEVALAVCGIPQQKEFASWSFEAREAVLDALCASFGTTAALQAVLSSYQNPNVGPRILAIATKALQACLTHSKTGISSSNSTTRQHETAVLVMRGLLHLLQFKEILPCGEKGKLDAHAAAATTLQELIEGFSRASLDASRGRRSSLGDATNQRTPGRRKRRSTGGLRTPAATVQGKSPGRRRRSNVETPGTPGGHAPLLSPALKGRRSSVGTAAFTPASSLHCKPRPVWSVFVSLLQKLATTQGLERANVRVRTVDVILHCSPALPLGERAHFLRYVLRLVKSKVSCHRLVACELLGRILAEGWLSTHQEDTVAVDSVSRGLDGESTTAGETPANSCDQDGTMGLPAALWKALQGRLVDKLAAVRARAATSIEGATAAHPDWLDEGLLSSLRKRALRDETATVRKAAVLALKQVLMAEPGFLSELYIATFCELCQDSSLLTRKAAADSITNLLETYLDHPAVGSLLEQAWATCVLPMVLDEDVTSKAIGSLDQVVIAPLLFSAEESDSNMASRDAAWRLLAQVASSSGSQGASKGGKQALQTALRQMAVEDHGRVHKHLWKHVAEVAQHSLENQETSEAQLMGAWGLLEALLLSAPSSKQVKVMVQTVKRPSKSSNASLEALCGNSWKFLLNRCRHTPSTWIHGTLKSCLCVTSYLARGLDADSARDFHNDLYNEIRNLSFPPEVTGAAINALCAITTRLDGSNPRSLCSEWIRSIYEACEMEMTSLVKSTGGWSISVDGQRRLVRALFCVGELSMVGFRPDDDEHHVHPGEKDDEDQLRGIHEKPSKRLQELVQALLPPTLPRSTVSSRTPPAIRAHAFTVLGKLCLRDEILAKNSLNILARELHPSAPNPNTSVQSNALLVLGDLCVRYTNMADRYLPVMASCLQSGTSDPETSLLQSSSSGSAITRKHAVLLLSSLLLQDYIKWRGLLFHRFLVACSDENEEVAALAENILSGPLSTRNPKLFFNHFVEALFVLNKCTAHPIYIAAASQGDGGSGIAVGFEGIYLNGELGRLRRRRMYEFLLGKMSDEEKIGVTARLAKEVLGEAVNSEGDLGKVCQISNQDVGSKLQSAWNVLTDAFAILTSDSIKVGKINNEELIDDPNVPNPTRQVSIAKNRLLSKISRKQLIEIVLPILCNLKTKLQGSCSPLLKDLMSYLLDIFKAYKTEVKEFLANDPTLLQEIEYDFRQHAAQAKSANGIS